MELMEEKDLYKNTILKMYYILFEQTEDAYNKYESAIEENLPGDLILENKTRYDTLRNLIVHLGLTEHYNQYTKKGEPNNDELFQKG